MSIYKPKGSPYYHYDFVIEGHRFYGSTGQKGKMYAQRVEDAKRSQAANGPMPVEMSLDVALGTYFEHVAADQPSAETTRTLMENLLKGLGGNIQVSQITQPQLLDYIKKRRIGVSNATVNRDLQCLRRVINWVGDMYEVSVPVLKWRKLLLREPKERVRELSCAEQDRLFEHLREDLHPIALFCMDTGVRLSGARTLVRDRVDFAEHEVTVWAKGGEWLKVPVRASTLALIADQPRVCDTVFTYECRKNGLGLRKGQRYPITKGRLAEVMACCPEGSRDQEFSVSRLAAHLRQPVSPLRERSAGSSARPWAQESGIGEALCPRQHGRSEGRDGAHGVPK